MGLKKSRGKHSRCRAPFFQRHDRHRPIHRLRCRSTFHESGGLGLWMGRCSVVERIENEPRGACDRARSDALQTCIRLGPRGTRTMKQSFASAARLRGGGPILTNGSMTMFRLGSPPPRIVSGQLGRTNPAGRAETLCLRSLSVRLVRPRRATRRRAGLRRW